MKKFISVFAAACMSFAVLSGCTPKEETEFSSLGNYFLSMNTEANLVVSDIFTSEKKNKFDELCSEISTALNGINNSLSSSVASSSIYRFNQAQAGETVEISLTAFKVLSLAKSVYELTDGYYNPAVYYNVLAYGFNEATDLIKFDTRIPPDSVIEKYNQLASHFCELEVYQDDTNKCYAKKPDATVEIDGTVYSMKIDLGGIGKGYAVDEVNKLIDRYGFRYGYFSFGTSSILIKEHYKNGDYNLALTNPRSDFEGNVYVNTSVRNVGLSTSGDYERFFLFDSDGDGVKEWYCHVFDPTTGKPVQTGIMSATVIGGSAAEADALTTAIMAMGKQGAVEFINEKLTDRKVVFTYNDNERYEIVTNVPEGGLNVVHSKFQIVNTVSEGKIVLG